MISILIPSKNEPYLEQTIKDIEEHKELDTEVLWMEDDGRGQRAITNALARQSRGKYVMKVDAHCSFSQGFDRVMLEHFEDDMIMAPYLLRLDAEKWLVKKPAASRYCFDTNFVMQYDKETDEFITETMCLQGSAWMMTKENYFKWNVCDESLGSWGGQAVELGIKAYLNGGRCVTNKHAYYGHLFRIKEDDFPYKRDERPGKKATEELIKRYKNQSIAGLIERFNYPADWTVGKVNLL